MLDTMVCELTLGQLLFTIVQICFYVALVLFVNKALGSIGLWWSNRKEGG